MDVITHYDKLIDEDNDPFRDPLPLQEHMNNWDGQKFIDSMRLNRQKKVLEIGVGTGRIAAKTADECLSFFGMDISPKTIQRAQENLSKYGNVKLVCADFSKYVFDESFDVIYSTLTLLHFEDKQAFISKVASLLNIGGIFCLSIDKNQSEYIDMGTRKLRVFPDNAENIALCIKSAGLKINDKYETEYAHIFVCEK